MSNYRPVDPGMTPRDRWIPWMFVAFFAVVFAVNAVFVTVALKTKPGVVNNKAYETGVRYNETLAKAAAEEKLGWTVTLSGLDACTMADCRLDTAWLNAAGKPLEGLTVTYEFMRPVRVGLDFGRKGTFDPKTQTYVLKTGFPAPGNWSLFLTARDPSGQTVQTQRDIVVKR